MDDKAQSKWGCVKVCVSVCGEGSECTCSFLYARVCICTVRLCTESVLAFSMPSELVSQFGRVSLHVLMMCVKVNAVYVQLVCKSHGGTSSGFSSPLLLDQRVVMKPFLHSLRTRVPAARTGHND